MTDRNSTILPKPSSLARDMLDYIKGENYKMHEDFQEDIDASEHIFDRLHKKI